MKKLFTLTVLMGFVVVACAPLLAVTNVDANATSSLAADRLIPYSSTTTDYNQYYGTTTDYYASGTGRAPVWVGNPGANLQTPSVISIQNISANWSLGPVKGATPTILAAVPTINIIAGVALDGYYVPLAFDFNDADYVDIAQLMIWSSDSSTITNIGTSNPFTSNGITGNFLSSTGITANNTKLLFKLDINPDPLAVGYNYSYVTNATYLANTSVLNSTNGVAISVNPGSSKTEAALLIPVEVFAGLSATTQIYVGLQTGGTADSGGDEQVGFIGSFSSNSFLGSAGG